MVSVSNREALSWPESWGPAPRWATLRNADRPTFGPAVARIAELGGMTLFPAQRYIVDVALEIDPETGDLWYQDVDLLLPRRSGKTAIMAPVTLHRCGQPGVARDAWVTGQKRDNARKRWMDATDVMLPMLERSGMSARRKISHSFEELRWPSGSLFVPFAPDEDSMHGEDPDLVWVDELWSFGLADRAKVEAGYRPAWSVKPGQAWHMSAAGTSRSSWLKAERQRGRAAVHDPESRVAFFEWCVPDQVGGKPIAETPHEVVLAEIMANHPRAGFGLRPDFVMSEIRAGVLPALRAYGGLDEDTSDVETIIDGPSFRRARDLTVRIPDTVPVGFGVALDPLWRAATISAAYRTPEGVALTEVIRHDEGTRWAVHEALSLLDRWPGSVVAVAADAGSRDIGDTLLTAGHGARVLRISASNYAAACHRLKSGIEHTPNPLVAHLGERALVRAHHVATWRRTSGGMVWDGPEPVTPLSAHSLAVWACDHMPTAPPEPPPFRIY